MDLPPEDEIRKQTVGGCRFAPRCPFIMDRCRQSVPPLYRVAGNQHASCFLYADQATKVEAAPKPPVAPL